MKQTITSAKRAECASTLKTGPSLLNTVYLSSFDVEGRGDFFYLKQIMQIYQINHSVKSQDWKFVLDNRWENVGF